MPLTVETHVLGPLENNVFVLRDETSGALAVVDPALGMEPLVEELSRQAGRVTTILITHAHFDHVGGLALCKPRFDALVLMHAAEVETLREVREHAFWFGVDNLVQPPDPDRFVGRGDRIHVGTESLQVLETPGHSPGGLSFYCEPSKLVLVGDALFAGGIGRTDLPGGNHEQLLHSIRTRLFSLPDDTLVYPGHGPVTTIGRERETNPFF